MESPISPPHHRPSHTPLALSHTPSSLLSRNTQTLCEKVTAPVEFLRSPHPHVDARPTSLTIPSRSPPTPTPTPTRELPVRALLFFLFTTSSCPSLPSLDRLDSSSLGGYTGMFSLSSPSPHNPSLHSHPNPYTPFRILPKNPSHRPPLGPTLPPLRLGPPAVSASSIATPIHPFTTIAHRFPSSSPSTLHRS